MLQSEFEVKTADSIAGTIELVNRGAFDLLLLCHSLNDDECKVICAAVFSRTPAARVLQLTAGWGDIRTLIGPEEQTSAVRPQNLVRKVSEMIRSSQGATMNSSNPGTGR
ncbi:MAG TPA: hypothetical protein VMU48_20995 [Terracidiphilus sp.]|nr:hypothetical protein [Terracidiphilus sp.]